MEDKKFFLTVASSLIPLIIIVIVYIVILVYGIYSYAKRKDRRKLLISIITYINIFFVGFLIMAFFIFNFMDF